MADKRKRGNADHHGSQHGQSANVLLRWHERLSRSAWDVGMTRRLLSLLFLIAPACFAQTNSNVASLDKVIYAAGYGMVCDGVTNDTTALTTAIAAGGKNAHIILPPSVNPCLINVESGSISVYDGSWISGAGKYATTLKRANGGSANNNIFTVASGGAFGTIGNVLFTDFTIDGNYLNETGGSNSIAGASQVSKFTVLRMRIINSWTHGINLGLGAGNNSDVLIADSDFETNGLRAGCVGVGLCFDTSVQEPLRIKITRNSSSGSQNFAAFQGANGAGQLTISENNVNGCLGFGVALGGGGTNPGPAAISDNTFNCPASAINTIDLAFWQDIRVENNTITLGAAGSNYAAIADAPPANHVQVIGNHIIGNDNLPNCIALGGSDLLIENNYCNTTAGAGIVVAVGSSTQAKNISIIGNTTKNAGRALGGVGGIELFLAPSGTASLGSVIIKGNRSFDDQGSPTQGYGIVLARSGQTTGFSNVTIEGNDLRGKVTGGILNNATSTSGFLVQNNPGDTNVGVCASSASPAVCGVASAGSVAIANPATTIQVNTTAVGSASKITVFEDASLGTLLGVTCNATLGRTYMVTARSAGASFTITASATPAANSACLNYHIDPAN
jgi:hypothetical protein